jgi:hypothetical protein
MYRVVAPWTQENPVLVHRALADERGEGFGQVGAPL